MATPEERERLSRVEATIEHLATKADFQEVKADIARLESRLRGYILGVLGLALVAVGILLRVLDNGP